MIIILYFILLNIQVIKLDGSVPIKYGVRLAMDEKTKWIIIIVFCSAIFSSDKVRWFSTYEVWCTPSYGQEVQS